jgi:hypothetical protein
MPMNFEWVANDNKQSPAGEIEGWQQFCEEANRLASSGALVLEPQRFAIWGTSYSLAELKKQLADAETKDKGWAEVRELIDKAPEGAKGIVRASAPKKKKEQPVEEVVND